MPTRPTTPPAVQPDSPNPDSDRPSPQLAVRRAVLIALRGSPGVMRVVVRPLWPNHFRVNVFVNPDTASVSIAHSYFVKAGDAGEILWSNPPLPAGARPPGPTAVVRG